MKPPRWVYGLLSRDEVRAAEYALTPGRYVGSALIEGDGEPFLDKMMRLAAELDQQFEAGKALEKSIRANLQALGFLGFDSSSGSKPS